MLEAALRTDDGWVAFPVGWRIAAVVMFFVAVPAADPGLRRSIRCSRPSGVRTDDRVRRRCCDRPSASSAACHTTAVILMRAVRAATAGDPVATARSGPVIAGRRRRARQLHRSVGHQLGDWIGGFIVLSIPVEAGLVLRYRGRSAQPDDRRGEVARARAAGPRAARHGRPPRLGDRRPGPGGPGASRRPIPTAAIEALAVIEEEASTHAGRDASDGRVRFAMAPTPT